MKLKVPKLFSQRNSPWSPILLGYNASKYTIGTDGCLITSFGMYVDKTPDIVNQMLKDNSGYSDGSGLFIWSKSTVLGLSQIYQSPYYADAVTPQGLSKMRSLLDEGRPLICHVDFNPGTPKDDMHWVLVYGYDDNDVFYIYDPWSGTATNLDVYGGVKRAVLEWRAYDKILSKDDGQDLQSQLDQCRKDRDRNWNWFVDLCTLLGVGASIDAATNEVKKLVGNDDALVKKDKQLTEVQKELQQVKDELQSQISKTSETKDKLDATVGEMEILKNSNTTLMGRITDLESAIVAPVRKGWKAFLVSLVDRL